MGKPVRGRWAHEGAWGQIPSGAFMEDHPPLPLVRCQVCPGPRAGSGFEQPRGLAPTSLADYSRLQEGNLATVRFH